MAERKITEDEVVKALDNVVKKSPGRNGAVKKYCRVSRRDLCVVTAGDDPTVITVYEVQ